MSGIQVIQPPGSGAALDADLTAIAALSPSNDDIIQRKAGAWTNRTMAQLTTDLGLSSLGMFNVMDYGATRDGETDDATALQAALTAAFEAPGGTMYLPPGEYLTSAALTIPTGDGAVRILGAGRAIAGTNPSTTTGSRIRSTSTTANVFTFGCATTKRQSIIIESLSVIGNVSGGSTGHGLHFSAPFSDAAQYVTLRDLQVSKAKEHGIFFDGCVFESQLYDVRSEQCGGAGFKAALNNGGIPGETRMFGCTFDDCDVGIDISGGGKWSLHGITASYNTAHGLKANGVYLVVNEMQFEADGPVVALFENLRCPVLTGITSSGGAGDTIGLSFVACNKVLLMGFNVNSTTADAGYKDFVFDSSTFDSQVLGYHQVDDTPRYTLGTGGNVLRDGNTWYSGQAHARKVYSSSDDGTDDLAVCEYDSFVSRRTVASKSRHIRWPTVQPNGRGAGQRVTITIDNASEGTTTTTWDDVWHMAGPWTDPAAGKLRTITFEWVDGQYNELCRSAADITR